MSSVVLSFFSDLGRTLREARCLLLAVASIASLAGTSLAASATDAPVGKPLRIAIVVNKANPATTIEVSELQRIFLREKLKWPGGETITLLERSFDHPIHEQFARLVLRRKPTEMAEYWLRVKLTRGLEAPRVCASPVLVKRYIERTIGGIGYLYESEVDDSVKVVRFLDVP